MSPGKNHKPAADLAVAPKEQRADACEALECMRVLHKSGSNLVAEVLQGRDFIQWEHYPPDDAYDPDSRSQYYFHAHPASEERFSDYGHFHTFVRFGTDGGAADGISHLVGISMTREGLPERLFTVNRWVTGENWRPAKEVIGLLDRFEMDLSAPSWPLNRWLTSMVALYRQDIAGLLLERDTCVAAWQELHPDRDVYEDRGLEITSARLISLEDTIRRLRIADAAS